MRGLFSETKKAKNGKATQSLHRQTSRPPKPPNQKKGSVGTNQELSTPGSEQIISRATLSLASSENSR